MTAENLTKGHYLMEVGGVQKRMYIKIEGDYPFKEDSKGKVFDGFPLHPQTYIYSIDSNSIYSPKYVNSFHPERRVEEYLPISFKILKKED